MAILYCVPLGQSARGKFYKELQKCEYGDAVLVLPNRIVSARAKNEANVNCIGIDKLANKILNANGYLGFEEINRRSQELIIKELIEYLGGESKLEYFKKLAEKTGFVKAMTSLLGQLSRSGATEAQIVNAIEALRDEDVNRNIIKDQEITTLYRLYRAYLRNENWFDLEGKYKLANKILSEDKPHIPWKKVYFSDFYSFDRLQLDFIKELSSHCEVHIGLAYEESREDVFNALKNTYSALSAFCKLEKYGQSALERSEPLLHLAEHIGGSASKISTRDAVKAYEFVSREDEMRWALTDIKKLLRGGVAAGDILLTVRNLNNYSGLRKLADEYGVPVNLPHTAQLRVQPLSEFILLLFDAVSGDRSGAEAYFKILSSAFGKVIFNYDTESVEDLRKAKYYTSVKQVQVSCRELFDTVENPLLFLINDVVEKLPAKGKIEEYFSVLADFITELRLEEKLGALYKTGKISLQALKGCLLSKAEIINCLESLRGDYIACGLGEKRFFAADVRNIISEALREVELIIDEGRQDGVLITEVFNVQGLAYKYMYLMGVREGEFPAGNTENWIYNDVERAQLISLGIDMPTTAQAYSEDYYFFASAAAQATERLVLSWHKDDGAGASPYLEQIDKLYADLSIERKMQKEYASPQEVMQLGKAGDKVWLEEIIGGDVVAAASADEVRAVYGVYSGVLNDDVLQKGVADAAGSIFSVSRLENYAACPFRFLGQDIWRLEEFVEKGETAAAVDEGNLLHDVLARFMAKHLHEKLLKYDFASLKAELMRDFQDVCAEYAEREILDKNVLWQAEAKRLQNLLLQWLHYEYKEQAAWESFVPYEVEWDFSSKNGKPLRLSMDDGSKITFIGRIDRIDSDGSRLFVTDYKRSAAPSGVDLTDGLDLQLPVYLLAVNSLYKKGRAAGGGYFVLKNAERKSSIELEDLGEHIFKANDKLFADSDDRWQSFKESSENIILGYIKELRSGNFRVQPKKKCSDFCPLKNICRVDYNAGGEDNG